jgi:tripartite-type tricarboxylate transporter receptor subunit TctC
VVGFPPGGSGDFIARTLAEPLGRELGQTVIVDNRPGAGSNIASENVARSEPDGHSLLLGGNFSHAVNPALYRRVPFDPVADFTAITRLTDLPTVIAVRPEAGVATLAQLVERARASPAGGATPRRATARRRTSPAPCWPRWRGSTSRTCPSAAARRPCRRCWRATCGS